MDGKVVYILHSMITAESGLITIGVERNSQKMYLGWHGVEFFIEGEHQLEHTTCSKTQTQDTNTTDRQAQDSYICVTDLINTVHTEHDVLGTNATMLTPSHIPGGED